MIQTFDVPIIISHKLKVHVFDVVYRDVIVAVDINLRSIISEIIRETVDVNTSAGTVLGHRNFKDIADNIKFKLKQL